MPRVSLCCATLVSALILLPAAFAAGATVDYERDVFPILEKYCVACHTADEAQGSLVMVSYDELAKGGASGPAFTAGVPSSSRMLMMASGKLEPVMPPDGADGPDEAELELIATWIEQGASGPPGAMVKPRELMTPKIKTDENASQPITAMAMSPDGVTRAIASYGTVRLVTGDSDIPLTVLDDQPGKVNSLRFNHDGSALLVGSGVTGLRGRAAVYEVATGKLVTEIDGHNDVIQVAIFSPDETAIATASYDREILLWDRGSSKLKQRFQGHNGAIYSIAFSPDGRVLVSGCADETVKVWDVDTGTRLDTMSQPTDEVYCVGVTPDGQYVIAGSGDNRLRVWRLESRNTASINPLLVTRFVDESPLTHLAFTPDGAKVVVVCQSGNVKVLRTSDWTTTASLQPLPESASDVNVSVDGNELFISLMNGNIERRSLLETATTPPDDSREATGGDVPPVFLDLDEPQSIDEAVARAAAGNDVGTSPLNPIPLPRGSIVSGTIASPGESDWYSWDARRGEMWIIETDTNGLNSGLDSYLEICDADGHVLPQARLQAVSDSYFTFQGKDSRQNGDFRLFAWEEMKLNQYLYASGEVTKTWLLPRGADSGFNMYPGSGNRWTYFGTSGTVHALGEPAYIVRQLQAGESPSANGLPVFDIAYENDDAPTQDRGKDSYVVLKAPRDATYRIRIRDARGEGKSSMAYRLRVRPAAPGFRPSVTAISKPIRRGTGRELQVNVDRLDGFDGEVSFELSGLPAGMHSNFPVSIQAGQTFAIGNIWADIDAPELSTPVQPRVIARAMIGDRVVERHAGVAGDLTIGERPSATLRIEADPGANAMDDQQRFVIRRGQTISLVVKADRAEGFIAQIPLGNEQAGRNMPHGVYVDNIGLNGLLVRENESERRFFVTATEVAELGERAFFLTGAIDDNVTTSPVQLLVMP